MPKEPAPSVWSGFFYSGRSGEPPGTRTQNPLIKSQLLCQIELAAQDTRARLLRSTPRLVYGEAWAGVKPGRITRR